MRIGQRSKHAPSAVEGVKRQRRAAPRGVVALITILVIMSVMVSIGVTISYVAQNQIVLSGVLLDGEKAFAIADACAEEGLERLKRDAGFTGTTLSFDDGTCVSTVTTIAGKTSLVRGQGSYRDAIRIVDVNATITHNSQANAVKIQINSWKEAD